MAANTYAFAPVPTVVPTGSHQLASIFLQLASIFLQLSAPEVKVSVGVIPGLTTAGELRAAASSLDWIRPVTRSRRSAPALLRVRAP